MIALHFVRLRKKVFCMEVTWQMLLMVCPLVFLAGFVDSVAGGGGLISLPASYLAGLPPVLAAGTNKMSACLGTVASSARFMVGGKVKGREALLAAIGAFPGSWLGTRVLQSIPEDAVRVMMLIIIPVVAVVVVLQGKRKENIQLAPAQWYWPVSFMIGFAVGFYDGLVGPGTGTFLIIGFTMLLGMETVLASGTSKLVNLTSNVASLSALMAAGDVLYALALPAACCGILGNLLGASLTISKGTKFIRVMMLVVLALLLAKMLLDVVQ